MKRLLPFIFVCISLVAIATYGASQDDRGVVYSLISAPDVITTEHLK